MGSSLSIDGVARNQTADMSAPKGRGFPAASGEMRVEAPKPEKEKNSRHEKHGTSASKRVGGITALQRGEARRRQLKTAIGTKREEDSSRDPGGGWTAAWNKDINQSGSACVIADA